MAFTRVFTVEAATVSNGSTNEVTESDNDDHVVEKIKVIDEDGNLGDQSDVTIQIAGNSITDQVIPLAELTQTHGDLPVINAYWPSNKQLRFSYTNDASSGSLTLKFVVYVRDGSGVSDNTPAADILSTPLM
jgi:hypothetical protein